MPSKPRRIQRKRVNGWKMPPNTIYVGRPTKWGNPFIVSSEPDRLEHYAHIVVEFRFTGLPTN